MLWYVIIGFFAAVGLLFFLWLGRGLFLTGPTRETVAWICPCGKETVLLRRYRWMRDLGLTRCRIVLIGSDLPVEEQRKIMESFPGVRFQTPEEWLSENQERLDGNG